jgi:hypothetical protein
MMLTIYSFLSMLILSQLNLHITFTTKYTLITSGGGNRPDEARQPADELSEKVLHPTGFLNLENKRRNFSALFL